MDPGAVLHPVGPEPPRVYWIRRAIAIALLVVIVMLLAYACTSGGGEPTRDAGDKPAPVRTHSVTVTPSVAPTHHRPPRCRDAQLQVTASTDAPTYAEDVAPKFTAVLRNSGSAACRFPSRPSSRVWTVVSGVDRIWSSADCTQADKPTLSRLKPGKTVAYTVTWDRHRSESGCPSTGAAAQDGTYRLTVRIAGVEAEPVVFRLSGSSGG